MVLKQLRLIFELPAVAAPAVRDQGKDGCVSVWGKARTGQRMDYQIIGCQRIGHAWRIVELIDVLWLRGSEIIAAFEVESTTSIYSGLLRMSDLIAMQPNLKIPLYLVAPDERRGKVITEVNRPTFSRLSPPMSQVCRFISFSTLEDRVAEVASVIRYLRPQFLDDLSESCEPEDV